VDYREEDVDSMAPAQVRAEYESLAALFAASLDVPKN